MPRRARPAVPLVLALLAGCGGADEPEPIPVTCGRTADGGTLTVNDPLGYTCGSAASPAVNGYTFTAAASALHTVTLVTTSGDADLCVRVQGGGLVECSVKIASLPDAITFAATAATGYLVEVEDASFTPPSTYGVKVTSP